jgi:hypothetical protein
VGRGPAAETPPAADGTGEKHLSARAAGIISIAAYVLAIAVFEIMRRTVGFPEPSDFALTPAALAEGKVWLLFTSALLVSGPPLLELAGLVLAIGVLARRDGPASFWRAGFAGHLGGTLTVYAAIGVLWVIARSTVRSAVYAPDYGVSAVWLGVLGAIFVSVLPERRQHALGGLEKAALALCVTAAVVGAVFFDPVPAGEHTLAFLIGAVVQASATNPW